MCLASLKSGPDLLRVLKFAVLQRLDSLQLDSEAMAKHIMTALELRARD